MTRCYNKNDPGYFYYGEKGIEVCKSWHNYLNFYNDMGDRQLGMTLDRIDNNKGYCKENCRWADRAIQSKNRKSNKYFTYMGQTKIMSEWCIYFNVSYGATSRRIARGWSFEDAFLNFANISMRNEKNKESNRHLMSSPRKIAKPS